MFSTVDRPSDDDAINIQLSMEGGHPGFDWVLLGRRNIEDKERFVTFAQTAGYKLKKREMRGVHYLRVEDGDLAKLCNLIITGMYKVPTQSTVDMIVEGFEWTP